MVWSQIIGVKLPGDANQVLREVRINSPIPHRICVRHRVAGNARAAKTQVVQLGGLRFKTGFDVPQTLAPCELGESKTMELVMTREMLDLAIAIVTRNATTKNVPRHVTHDLRENVLAGVHRSLRDRNRSRRSEQVEKFKSITPKRAASLNNINQLCCLRPTTLGHHWYCSFCCTAANGGQWNAIGAKRHRTFCHRLEITIL